MDLLLLGYIKIFVFHVGRYLLILFMNYEIIKFKRRSYFQAGIMGRLEGRSSGNRTKTLVLDFNGTLADDLRLFIEIVRKVFEKRGYEFPSDKKIETLRGESAKEVAKALLGHRKWLYRIILAVSEGLPLYFKEKNNIKPFDGIINAVNDLSKDYEIIILSSNSKNTIKYVLDKWGLNYDEIHHSWRWFGLERLFGKDITLQKISKERGLKNSPEKILYVGDEARDVDACRKAGVNILPVTWGYNKEIALIKAGVNPEFLVHNPQDIPTKIKLVEDRMLKGEKLPTLNPLKR